MESFVACYDCDSFEIKNTSTSYELEGEVTLFSGAPEQHTGQPGGATITDSSASGASLTLSKRAEEGKTTRYGLVVGKSKTVLNIIKY